MRSTKYFVISIMLNMTLNLSNIEALKNEWVMSKPFNHIVVEDFLDKQTAQAIVKEFPDFENDSWKLYNNAIEVKKLLNHWDKFGPETYRLFTYLNSHEFIAQLELLTECRLFPDYGLNGGGLHTHGQGGKLNVHLDYSIHPKMKLERRLNILIYLTPNWQDEWGGFLGLWEQAQGTKSPGNLVKQIAPKFNRAVIFDTTQNSWHGLPEVITCPSNISRNSLAVYYLCEPRNNAQDRGKALFAPYKNQAHDSEVLSLIEKRSQVNNASAVYGDKK